MGEHEAGDGAARWHRVLESQRPESLRPLLAGRSDAESFGCLRGRQEIRIHSRRHQPVGAILAVLDLDPDRLDSHDGQRLAVELPALLR